MKVKLSLIAFDMLAVIECVSKLGSKGPVYAALVGLVNVELPDYGKKVCFRMLTNVTIRIALHTVQARSTRLSLAFRSPFCRSRSCPP